MTGLPDRDDFQALTARWTALRGRGDQARLTAAMMGWWASLRDVAGAGQVTLGDVLAVVDQLGQMPEAVTGTAEVMFDAVDEDTDGRVSPAEYRQMIEAWTGGQADTSAAFALLDLNGDGYLSRSEFAEHWTGFWVGDNPDAPGSWVFGTFPATAARR